MGKRRRIHARWIDDLGEGTFHLEGPGFIANFTTGLRDNEGREVVHVSISADGDRYKGDPEWWVHPDDLPNSRWSGTVGGGEGVTKSGVGFRLIKMEPNDGDSGSDIDGLETHPGINA